MNTTTKRVTVRVEYWRGTGLAYADELDRGQTVYAV